MFINYLYILVNFHAPGSAFPIRIRIQVRQMNANPDQQLVNISIFPSEDIKPWPLSIGHIVTIKTPFLWLKCWAVYCSETAQNYVLKRVQKVCLLSKILKEQTDAYGSFLLSLHAFMIMLVPVPYCQVQLKLSPRTLKIH
jgi:hypothetical protein